MSKPAELDMIPIAARLAAADAALAQHIARRMPKWPKR